MRNMCGIIVVVLTFMVLCLQQHEQPTIEEVQPELSEEGFIDLVNNILVEKVSLDMFDMQNGDYIYIRNTYDHDGREIHVRMSRSPTKIHISVSSDHFRKGSLLPRTHPQEINVKGLFTPHIENQVDITPPSDFNKCREYTIVIMTYKGTLRVCRGGVSVHFKNIGALSPTPTPPDPRSFISKVLPYVVIAVFAFAAVLVMYGIVLRRRKKL